MNYLLWELCQAMIHNEIVRGYDIYENHYNYYDGNGVGIGWGYTYSFCYCRGRGNGYYDGYIV